MARVGDVIISARELMTDLPQQTSLAPNILGVAQTTVAGGGFSPGNTVWLVATALTPWGETLAGGEQNIAITGGNNAVQITLGVYPDCNGVRIYYTSGPASPSQSGLEFVFEQFPFTPGSGNLVVTIVNNFTMGLPPQRNTAYRPDTDGAAVGAFAIYRWLNQALAWAAAKNRGGLPDFGAVGTVNSQPNYVVPGYWKKIDSAWFDGYPLGLLVKNNVFRRNPVPGFSGMLIVFQATDRLMIEAWPQPNRTSAQTTLASPMLATDTTATLTSTAAYVLGFGMTQIGSEIVNFSNIFGNQLQGLQRGMCGTVPASHNIGESVTELNLMIAGYRVPATYSVGQSASTLYLPPGWDEALTTYMLYRFRKAEQDEQGAAAALKEATQKMSDLSANRIIAGPRQIQPYAAIGPEVGAGLGTAFGGVIIP